MTYNKNYKTWKIAIVCGQIVGIYNPITYHGKVGIKYMKWAPECFGYEQYGGKGKENCTY